MNRNPSSPFLKSVCLALGLAWCGPAMAAGGATPEAIQFFETKIRPLLAENCYQCHGGKKQKGGLRLDNLSYMLEGGKSGPALVPGDTGKSHLFRAVSYTDPDYEMPPDGKLPDHQIADLKRWIELGAPWPAAEVIAARKPGEFTAEERGWWSFQPLMKVTPPETGAGPGVIRNDVDRFVVEKLRHAGLTQAPEADRRELARRLYFNLHGLPPTPAQMEAWLQDQRPDAWERLVDELLDSPRYGMRQGQHWLDLVRYAESDGYREDAYRPDAWPYRDYVIKSFNADKPYDQFVREQLAGDELNPDDPGILIGTAFLRHGIYEWNQADAEMQRDTIVKELPGLTGELFLGLSVGCAECHDHKFDPILQKDYYRFRSFFEPMLWRDDLPLATPDEKAAHATAMAAWDAGAAAARTAWDAERRGAEASGSKKAMEYFPPAVQAMKAKLPADLTPYEKQVLYLVDRRVAVEVSRVLDKLKPKSAAWAAYAPFEALKPQPLQPAFVATDVGTGSPPTKLKSRQGESVVEPGFLTILTPGELKLEPLKDRNSTGRRTALANWITDPANPLATRVIVNRVWQYHFGRGLSGNTSDFGQLGEKPSHPELLDWLTAGFIENGWRFKWLHRQILLSATYRQSSMVPSSPRSNTVDPENKLLWRFRPQRLDAEQTRDTLLLLAGEMMNKAEGPAEEGLKPVPSIFTRKRRNSPDEFLTRFDAPPGFQSVAKRDATNTALQSLLMANGDWPLDRARVMAVNLFNEDSTATLADFTARAVDRVMGRPARADEVAEGVRFLKAQQEQIEAARAATPPADDPEALVDGSQRFPGLAKPGAPTAVFQPGTAHEKLLARTSMVESSSFFVEAMVSLDSVYPDASVRTIVSRWNGDQADRGWSLGVTGGKSRHGAGQLIMQLNGDDFQAALTLEVVVSGLTVPLKKPVYVAAVLSPETLPGRTYGGNIRFLVRDLSDAAAVVQEAQVPHALGAGFVNPERGLVIGGRDGQSAHYWMGGIHRFVMGNGTSLPSSLLPGRTTTAAGTLVEFAGAALTGPDNAFFKWIKPPPLADAAPPAESSKVEALGDLFHVLINSNEFLYLP
ncbi:MAG: PSD1 and planctomycete cytochrome C domain-containing protein [Verrucomicrobiota bacterium]